MDRLSDYGALGIIAAFLIYEVTYLQKKIFSVIENNTAALNKFASIVEKYFSCKEDKKND